MARAAVENACWDVTARVSNIALYELLGGTRKKIPCGVSIGIQDSPEQLLEKIRVEIEAGYLGIFINLYTFLTRTTGERLGDIGWICLPVGG